jgi:hypothetical protein
VRGGRTGVTGGAADPLAVAAAEAAERRGAGGVAGLAHLSCAARRLTCRGSSDSPVTSSMLRQAKKLPRLQMMLVMRPCGGGATAGGGEALGSRRPAAGVACGRAAAAAAALLLRRFPGREGVQRRAHQHPEGVQRLGQRLGLHVRGAVPADQAARALLQLELVQRGSVLPARGPDGMMRFRARG